MLDTYKSVVYYHEDKPRWAETVKVRIISFICLSDAKK